MRKNWTKGLALVLALILVAGLLPAPVFAAVDSTGKPKDVNNALVLSIYTPEGKFPGEPAVYGTSNYKNFDSSFKVKSGATFANSANNQLDWDKIKEDIVQGTSSGSTTVWGVYDANGTKDYFKSDATIIKHENEIKMIQAIKDCTAEQAENYEIIWYVIKLQHSSSWFTSTTEWHIDGVIKEKEKISINYYGNGNTSGSAPEGKTNHVAGEAYTIAGSNMKKKINGVDVAFLGWSAKADGTGAEAGFYQPGDVINPTENISLYAMWDTTTQYTATVNTYLDGVLTDEDEIHNADRELYLSTDEEHYYALTRSGEGEYSTKITGNGKFHLYHKNADGTYEKIGDRQLTIYNQNGSMVVNHYSVTYDANGGGFEADPGKQIYYYGEAVTAISGTPSLAGHRFIGWNTEADGTGTMFKPGADVTSSITAPIILYAQWEKTVNVTVNVTVNHVGTSGGWNQAPGMEEVVLTVASKENKDAPYLEVGDTLKLNETDHVGFAYSEEKNEEGYVLTTKYAGYTLTDMPGGEAEYTVVTSKSGYETNVTSTKLENGDWVINVDMIYKPSNFDVTFTVEVDENIPAEYVPEAAIVKVTFWATGDECWKVITQQAGGEPGVRVDFDPANRTATGSYPVWKYEDGDGEPVPYGYRVVVTSFVYPDGTIVPVNDPANNLKWTDDVYTATLQDVKGGNTYGELDGAYYNDETKAQSGNLDLFITMDLHDVIFDANADDATVNGVAEQTVEKQYKIPSFKDYVPIRAGGYTFGGWYLDKECTKLAAEGVDLTENVTLYAKWIAPLTISGTVSISGTYLQDGETVYVHTIDKAMEAIVVLQEIRNGKAVEINSQVVKFKDYTDLGTADYAFTGIPNEGKLYQINILELNYGTAYDNEIDADTSYAETEYNAVFGDDNTADVDAFLQFVPPSYEQFLNVDATAIGEVFRPTEVLSEVMYRDTGDNHPFLRISQHDVPPKGVEMTLTDGVSRASESIWKWHTDGTLYEYQMNISKVDGVEYNSDTAPFYITYEEAAYWDADADAPSGELKATLVPNQYQITFDLNAGEDAVTGMESYLDSETGIYGTIHTWSFDTKINATPVREGYIFDGWEAEAYDGTKIAAANHQDVVLTAKWIPEVTYTVTTVETPDAGGDTRGGGTYVSGKEITLVATAAEGYVFAGWFANGERVSQTEEFTHVVDGDIQFEARFNRISTYTNRYAYIFGYSDTVMGPAGPLLRCEAAAMVHRLAKQNNQRGDFVYDEANPSFTDIAGMWFQCGMEYIHYRGGFNATEGAAVYPYAQLTRGEVFKIVALGLGFTDDTTMTYDEYGALLAEYGYIIGTNENGELNSSSLMNRAQFVTLYNRIIGRSNALLIDADGNAITHETYGFTDLVPGTWYYEDMLRGTSAYRDGYVNIEDRAIRNVVDEYN